MFIDPDGRQIDVEYGEGKSFTYEANMSYEDWASKNGENEFVKNTITSLNYMYRDDKENVIFAAISLKDVVTLFEVTEFGSGNTQFEGQGGGFGGLKDGRIGFNPYEGLEIMSDDQASAYVAELDKSPNATKQEKEQMKQLIGGTGSVQSPALGLGHELGHFVNASKNWQSYQNRDRHGTAAEIWRGSSEEKYTVKNWETPLAAKLQEPIRTNVAGISRRVSSPIEFTNKQKRP